ncbi:hypothetical protein [Dactylosporangium sp. NPDC049140]|uniref:hypothetical protein n=1 Tax=Dactylosporangium sp. NPDC049140 TaxID=3155647 RepID=UPI0033F0113E
MLYVLPDTPPISLVGPDDTAWWTALGEAPAGRSALVIGDPANPTAALVIAASLPELGAYLPVLHTTLDRTVQDRLEMPHPAPRPPLPTPATTGAGTVPAAEADTTSNLVALPHTGIQVPDATFRVTTYQELPTPDGVAYTATVHWGSTPVGTIHNEGRGGATRYWPAAGSALDQRSLAEFVAASRGADGRSLTEEDLLEALVTEYEHARHVAHATRTGRSPIQLRAPLGVGADEAFYTADRRVVAKVATPEQRAALTARLQRLAVPDGMWWQLWTGQAWEDLTTPTQPTAPGPDRPEPR